MRQAKALPDLSDAPTLACRRKGTGAIIDALFARYSSMWPFSSAVCIESQSRGVDLWARSEGIPCWRVSAGAPLERGVHLPGPSRGFGSPALAMTETLPFLAAEVSVGRVASPFHRCSDREVSRGKLKELTKPSNMRASDTHPVSWPALAALR